MEGVGGAVLAGEALVGFERVDVGGVFDLPGAVEGAVMGGEPGVGVEDAPGVEGCADGEGPCDVTMGNRVGHRIARRGSCPHGLRPAPRRGRGCREGR